MSCQQTMPFVTQESGAELSNCRAYRYRLWRRWDVGTWVCWLMCNPSTADAELDDPTIRRCIGYSRAWGYAGLDVVNLFAFRATDPRAMKSHHAPVGKRNDAAILSSATGAGLVVCAWGNHGAHVGRADRVLEMLGSAGVEPRCLQMTKAGEPGHPLYLPKNLTPVVMGPA